jgi:hypothetical protein
VSAWKEIGAAEQHGGVRRGAASAAAAKSPTATALVPARKANRGLPLGFAAAVLMIGVGAACFLLLRSTKAPVGIIATPPKPPLSTAAPAAAATVPYPAVAPDGENIYPVGVWTRIWTAEQERRIARGEGAWMKPADAAGVGASGRPQPQRFTNCALRVRFRGQRLKDDFFPQINLRSTEGGSLNLHVYQSGSQLLIRRAKPGAGFPLLAEIKLSKKLRQPSREYVMEFYAIGQTLIGRIDGETVTAQLDEPPVPGTCGLYGAQNDFLRDAQFLNLDGLPETEALKLASSSRSTSSSPSVPAAEAWQDALQDQGFLRHAGIAADGHQITVSKPGIYTIGDVRDGAIRVRAKWSDDLSRNFKLVARMEEGKCYQFEVKNQHGVGKIRDANQSNQFRAIQGAKESALATPLVPGASIEMELRIIGAHLVGRVNGQILLEADDASLTSGKLGFGWAPDDHTLTLDSLEVVNLAAMASDSTYPGGTYVVNGSGTASSSVLLKPLEVLDLDAAAPATPNSTFTPATATKDAPVTN